ncbi:MAG TPA: CoA transferase, partial [Mycobacteriales bacterium]|nr:CoA transferase [Mycobacteriales bacterium]
IVQLTIEEAVRALDDARIASARLNEVSDLIAHEQLVARDRWRAVATPVGRVRALRSPMEPVGEAPMGAVPELGQHTAAVLAELGYADAEIDAMRTAGDILS